MLAPIAALALTLCLHPPGEERRLEKAGAVLAVDPLGRGTWVVDAENDAVALLGDDGGRRVYPLGGWPEHLVVTECGNVWVSLREGAVAEVDSHSGQVRLLRLAGEPRALALDERGRALFVALEGAKALARVDTGSLEVVATRTLQEAPGPIALTPDGLAVLGRRSARVHQLGRDLQGGMKTTSFAATGSTPWHGFALVAEGPDLIAVFGAVDTGRDDFSARGAYGGFRNPLEVRVALLRDGIHASPHGLGHASFLGPGEVTAAAWRDGVLVLADRGSRALLAVSLDLNQLRAGAMMSMTAGDGLAGVIPDGRGGWLALSAIDRHLLRFRVPPDALRARPQELGLFGLGTRGSLLGLGGLGTRPFPMGQAFLMGLAPARLDLLRMATPVDAAQISPAAPPPAIVAVRGEPFPGPVALPAEIARWQPLLLPLGPGRWDDELRLGARLFHDVTRARTTARGLTCAGCHPDGRSDGLVWRQGPNALRTPVLAGRLDEEGPFNWFGTEPTLAANIASTVRRLGGRGLRPAEVDALGRYLREGLRAPPAVPGAPEELVRTGEQIFYSQAAGCATCHPSDGRFTDGLRHQFDRRTRPGSTAARRGVLTPSLLHLAHSERFLHDGRATSLDELVVTNGKRMGDTRHLDAGERHALVAYLRSL